MTATARHEPVTANPATVSNVLVWSVGPIRPNECFEAPAFKLSSQRPPWAGVTAPFLASSSHHIV